MPIGTSPWPPSLNWWLNPVPNHNSMLASSKIRLHTVSPCDNFSFCHNVFKFICCRFVLYVKWLTTFPHGQVCSRWLGKHLGKYRESIYTKARIIIKLNWKHLGNWMLIVAFYHNGFKGCVLKIHTSVPSCGCQRVKQKEILKSTLDYYQNC